MGNARSKPITSNPLVYREPTYKEERERGLPNWFFISETIGSPYRFELLRFWFDRRDPYSLVRQLQKYRIVGLVVWKLPLEALKTRSRYTMMSKLKGKIYLIDWDEMPNDIVDEGYWCSAIYPLHLGGWARLYVGCPELFRYQPAHPSFWEEAPPNRIQKRIDEYTLDNSISSGWGDNGALTAAALERNRRYWEVESGVNEWLDGMENDDYPEYRAIGYEFSDISENRENLPETLSPPEESRSRNVEIDELREEYCGLEEQGNGEENPESEGEHSESKIDSQRGTEDPPPPYEESESSMWDRNNEVPPEQQPYYELEREGEADKGDYYKDLATWNFEYKSIPYHQWPHEVFSENLTDVLHVVAKSRAAAKLPSSRFSSSQSSISSTNLYIDPRHIPQFVQFCGQTPRQSIYFPLTKIRMSNTSIKIKRHLPSPYSYSDPSRRILQKLLPESYYHNPGPNLESCIERGYSLFSSSSLESRDSNDSLYLNISESRSSATLVPSRFSLFTDSDGLSILNDQTTADTKAREKQFLPANDQGYYAYFPNLDWVISEYNTLMNCGYITKIHERELLDRGSRGFIYLFSREVEFLDYVKDPCFEEMDDEDTRKEGPIVEMREREEIETQKKADKIWKHGKERTGFKVGGKNKEQEQEGHSKKGEYPSSGEIGEQHAFADFLKGGGFGGIDENSKMMQYIDATIRDWYELGYYDNYPVTGKVLKKDILQRLIAIYGDIRKYQNNLRWIKRLLTQIFAEIMERGWPPRPFPKDSRKPVLPTWGISTVWDSHSEDSESTDEDDIDVWAKDPPFPSQDEFAESLMTPAEKLECARLRFEAQHGSLLHWRRFYKRESKRMRMLRKWWDMVEAYWYGKEDEVGEFYELKKNGTVREASEGDNKNEDGGDNDSDSDGNEEYAVGRAWGSFEELEDSYSDYSGYGDDEYDDGSDDEDEYGEDGYEYEDVDEYACEVDVRPYDPEDGIPNPPLPYKEREELYIIPEVSSRGALCFDDEYENPNAGEDKDESEYEDEPDSCNDEDGRSKSYYDYGNGSDTYDNYDSYDSYDSYEDSEYDSYDEADESHDESYNESREGSHNDTYDDGEDEEEYSDSTLDWDTDIRNFEVWRERVWNEFPYRTFTRVPPPTVQDELRYRRLFQRRFLV